MLISVSDILKNSWEVYKKQWRGLVIYMAFLFIPYFAISVLGLAGVLLDSVFPESAIVSNIILMALLVAGALFSLWTSLALTVALNNSLQGVAGMAWRDVFGKTAPRLWPFIYTSIIAALIIIGGALLLIVPGIIFAIWYAFITYSIVLENKEGMDALNHSKGLVAGRWLAILWRLLIPGIVFALVTAAVRLILVYPITYFIGSEVITQLVDNILTALISAAIAPVATLAALNLYHSAVATPMSPVPAAPKP
ncbi:MAG: hypothetical protein Q7K39_01855 [Candidatus Magasanikbacteria bacterium]|nr:hypothetical protein [Candidatus Magasanikbacteria bacterium]